MIEVGDEAPAFHLPGMTRDAGEVSEYTLADGIAGGPLVLTFYMFDFHPACTEQLCALHDLDWFDLDHPVTTYAVSTDGAYSHRAFARAENISVPMLSDHDGSVVSAYGVGRGTIQGHAGVANRAAFVVDTDGVIRDAWAADEPTDQPDWPAVKTVVDEYRDA